MTIRFSFLFALLLLCIPGVGSQTVRLTLGECLSLALDDAPAVREAAKALEVARAGTGTFLDIPSTKVELSQSAIEGASMDNGLTFSQEIEFPTVYVARRKVLKARENLSREQLGDVRNALRGEVAEVYFSQLVLSARIAILSESLGLCEGFEAAARERFAAGESSRLEALNAERMRSRSAMALADARLALSAAQRRLGSLLGLDCPAEAADAEVVVLDLPEPLSEFDFTATSPFRVHMATLEVGEREVGLARQEFLPELSVGATAQLLLDGFNPYHIDRQRFGKGNFLGFSVGVAVPLFFTGKRSRLLEARRELELSRLRMDNDRLRLEAELADSYAALATAAERLAYFEREGLPQAAEMVRLSQVSYELGEIDYLEHMQNLGASSDIRLDYLSAVEQYNQTVIKIQTIKGNI